MRYLRKWMFAGMVLLLLGVLTIGVSAATVAEGTCGADGDNLTWVLDDTGTLTISGEGAMKDFYGCRSDENVGSRDTDDDWVPWNSYSGKIYEIVFADTVTTVGDYAFTGCYALAQINFSDSLSSIGYSAFADCSGLTQIVLPDSISSIGEGAFYCCSELTKASFNGNAPVMGSDVFASTHEDFTIYYDSTKTGWSTPTWNGYPAYPMDAENSIIAEGTCGADGDNLTWVLDDTGTLTISGEGAMKNYNSNSNGGSTAPWNDYREEILTVVFTDTVTTVGNCAFYKYSALTDITFPDSLSSIGGSAFSYCSGLTQITLPDSISSIGNSAFLSCSGLTQITLPDSISSIGNSAFLSCSGLTQIVLPDSLSSIGDSAFEGCSGLTQIVLPDSLSSIGDRVFYYCRGLTQIDLPDSLSSIGDRAFYYCDGLTQIVLPDSLSSIGDEAFRNCSGLTQIILPDSLSYIGNYVFYNCTKLTDITLPDSLTSLGNYVFSYCYQLKTVTLPENLSSIGTYTFAECTALEKIVFPAALTTIDEMAFSGCTKLAAAYFHGAVPTLGDSAFQNTAAAFTIFYIDGTEGWTTPLWNGYPTYPMTTFEASAKIVLSDTSVYRGETFTADIVLENAFPATALAVSDIAVSPECAEILSIEWLLPEGTISDIDPEAGSAAIAYDEAADLNGPVLRLTLRAAEVDGTYACRIVCSMTLEVDEAPMALSVTPGTVDIMDYRPGDSNGDTKLTSADAIYLLRHTLLPERYPLRGAWFDFNNDGTVDAKDAVYLLYHVLMPQKFPLYR
ncbi:MAG: leucine-rich repeat protein [Clostridia bacterium]|nr:leucine-rich repeat protein [Clostridia bacterium]